MLLTAEQAMRSMWRVYSSEAGWCYAWTNMPAPAPQPAKPPYFWLGAEADGRE